MNLTEWQKAYPYIVNKSTGIKLGDYEDARRKFLEAWGKANPYTGPTPNFGFTAQDWMSGGTPTLSDYDAYNQQSAYQGQMEEAFGKMLTPEQSAEYFSQKHDSYKKHQRMGQMAFLAAAGAMAAPALIGAMGAGGAGATGGGLSAAGTGSGVLGAVDSALASSLGGYTGLGASAIPSAVNLGSLGGIMSTGAGALGAGALGGLGEAAGIAGNNISAWLPSGSGALDAGLAQVPAWALPGGATASELAGMGLGSSSITSGGAFSSIGDYIKSLGSSVGKDIIKGAGSNWLNQLITGGTAAYTGNKATGQYNDLLKEINALYSPDSPYAKQMQQAMARKDAAAGRNSQYGSRAVELAAALTNSKANALTSAGYGNLMQQRGLAQNQFPASMIALLQSQQGQDLITKAGGGIGGWLSGLFTSGGDKVTPTTPNVGTNPNWWENWSGYIGGGP